MSAAALALWGRRGSQRHVAYAGSERHSVILSKVREGRDNQFKKTSSWMECRQRWPAVVGAGLQVHSGGAKGSVLIFDAHVSPW